MCLIKHKLGLTISVLKLLKSDINFTKPISQEDFYNKNGGPEEILKYVRLQGKTYGVAMEQIAKEHFNMDVRTSTRHDHKKTEKN